MAVDFTRLSGGSAGDPIVEPRSLFASLPLDRDRFPYMRDVQGEVLERWFDRRGDRDLVVKMNTGGGKTVVGLLMLKSSLNEGIGPGLYLTPDKYLADQVRAEARALGIDITDDPRSPAYRSGRAVCVTNVYRLFNGRTVFGTSSSETRISIGAVLIDDAHACLESVRAQFSLDIPATCDAYSHVLGVLFPALSEQGRARAEELRREEPSAVMGVPPWAWAQAQDKLVPHLAAAAAEVDSVGFNWPLVRDVLPLCRAAISTHRIEIAPQCLPVDQIPSFTAARRRIYLSATLADDSDLVTEFGADPDSIERPVVPTSAADIGDRLILSPLESHPALDHAALRAFVRDLSATKNTVVLAPSDVRASKWADVADRICSGATISATVNELRNTHLGLVVLSNRYDGIDLPGSACEILVVDGLPIYSSPLDRVDAEMVDGTERVARKLMQRVEQGMGRGVRSSNDSCVVILSDLRLASEVWSHGAQYFSPATAAQLELSREVSSQTKGLSLDEYMVTIDRILTRDPDWVAASRGAVARITSETNSEISSLAIARREAFDIADRGDPLAAADRLGVEFHGIDETPVRGWLKQLAASYLYLVDRAEGDKLQASARSDNRSAFRPVGSQLSPKMRRDRQPQANESALYLADRYADSRGVPIGIEVLISRLQPDPLATRDFERAVAELGEHLGFDASRPESELGVGPDVLWSLGDGTYWVIECKSGSSADSISKSDLAQLGHSVDWFEATYPTGSQSVPVLIHPARQCGPSAVAAAGTRVMTFDLLAELTERVRRFGTSVAALTSLGTSDVGDRLAAEDLTTNVFRDKWTSSIKPHR